MRIDNYAVSMNASYYNLEFRSIDAKVQSSISNTKTADVADVERLSNKNGSDELNEKLTKEILKNLHSAKQLEFNSLYVESRELNFNAKAIIQSGQKQLEINLEVNISQSFVAQNRLSLDVNQVDPLVISLDGTMPQLSSKKFAFDIDSDGTKDQISLLKSGNGFLALDKNGNGKIDNGSELFGASSGDGFSELLKYDDDNNGWIDENDAIFDKLRIWLKTDNEDRLIALGEVGIGAIFLGSTNTPFSLKSDINNQLGEIKKSGLVVFEDGKAGIISQVDLIATKETKDMLQELDKKIKSSYKDTFIKSFEKLNHTKDNTQEDNQTPLQKLQSRVKALESKLKDASDDQKASIQAQIGAIYAQMIMLLKQG